MRRWLPRISAVVLVALVAACDSGKARPATRVADTSAQLEGTLINDSDGTLTYWFEYGATPDLGSTTPSGSHVFNAAGNWPVSATVIGLDEATTYHYRLCVRNETGGGLCGAPTTLTTTTGEDSVHGLGISFQMPELGYAVGAIVDVTSAPDGTDVVGHVSRSPGTHYFRIADDGEATCLRVDGNRAAIGFTADSTDFDPALPLVHLVLHVEDGASGDRFAVQVMDEPPTTCPDPDTLLDATAGETVVTGGFTVHDHTDVVVHAG